MTHGDTGSFWSVFKKGVDQATNDLKARGVRRRRSTRTTTSPSRWPGINAAIAANAHVIATSVPDASALKGSLQRAASEEHRDHHRQLGPRRLRLAAALHGARRPDRGRRGPGRRQAVQVGRREEGADRDPRGLELGTAATGRRRQEDPRLGRRAGADDPEREVRHPGHEGQGAGGLQGQQVARRLPRPRPGRDDPVPRRVPKGTKAGHVRRRRRDQGDRGRPAAVRDRPAAVPPGLPAGRVRGALRHEPEHRRERPARADRARDHQQGERGAGGQARRRRARARTTRRRGGRCGRPPTPERADGRARHSDRTARRAADARQPAVAGCSRARTSAR